MTLVSLLGGVLQFLGFRPAIIWLPERIGHLVAEVDMLRKEHALAGDKRKLLFFFNDNRLANKAILEQWRRTLTVFVWPWLYEFIRANKEHLSNWEVISLDDQRYGQACSEYSGPPAMRLNDSDHVRGQAMLRELGIGPGRWYVCFHNREGGYLPNLAYHAYRDAPVSSIHKAMQWVVDQGGIAIRMGDPSMSALNPMEGVIDYAHSKFRDPFLDVYLCATCRFMIGCSSGLFCISGAFDRPIGCVNMAPMGSIPFYPNNRFVPKLVREVESQRLLTFDEILSGKSGNFWFHEEFESLGLETVANDADDILDLTREMYTATGHKGSFPAPNELQQRFRKLLRKEHTGYSTKAIIGAAFTHKHEHLFQRR